MNPLHPSPYVLRVLAAHLANNENKVVRAGASEGRQQAQASGFCRAIYAAIRLSLALRPTLSL
jgi:hypothetical protein